MFRAFQQRRQPPTPSPSGVRSDEAAAATRAGAGGEEEEDESKRMARRPSLARRLSTTLLGRVRSASGRRASKSTATRDGGEGDDEDEDEEALANCTLLTWGRNDLDQLLRDGRHDAGVDSHHHVLAARAMGSPTRWVALGLFHSLALAGNSGAVWGAGDNAEAQLDSTRVQFAGAQRVTLAGDGITPSRVAVGLNHSALVSASTGTVLTWGCNESGQLGRKPGGNTATATQQQQVEGAMRKERALSVACTENATLVLTERGQVWSFGESTRGELGRTDHKEQDYYLSSPVRGGLFCNPIASVSCGAGHVVAVTQSGRPMGWGWNKQGQLGFAPPSAQTRFQLEPVSMPLPSSSVVVRSAHCGGQHTALVVVETVAAEESGGGGALVVVVVLTAGANDVGQLGRHTTTDLLPSHEFHAMYPLSTATAEDGQAIAAEQVACGALHTLVLGSDGHVYGVGSDEFGELSGGEGGGPAVFAPARRLELGGGQRVVRVYAGGNASACLVTSSPRRPARRAARPGRHSPLAAFALDCAALESIAQHSLKSGSLGELKGALLAEFHCTGLNRCFSSPHTQSRLDASRLAAGMGEVARALLASKDGERFWHVRLSALFEEMQELAPVATEPDQLRCFLVGLLLPFALVPGYAAAQLIRALAVLPARSLRLVLEWLVQDLGAEFAADRVLGGLLVRNADWCVERRDWSRKGGGMPQTMLVVKALHSVARGRLPAQAYYLHEPDNWPQNTLIEEWHVYNQNKLLDPDVYFSLFNYSVVLSAETKWNVLMIDSQHHQISTAVSAAMSRQGTPFLELTVDRVHLVRDAARALSACRQTDLSKPLKVAFANEPGLDWGGVRKEFFELLSTELFQRDAFRQVSNGQGDRALWLNPTGEDARALQRLRPALSRRNPHFVPRVLCVDSYACFNKCEDNGGLRDVEDVGATGTECSVCGFSRAPIRRRCAQCHFYACAQCVEAEQGLEQEMQVHHQLVLTGALMGLAVYNSTLLAVHFPEQLYSGLLGKHQDVTLGLADLAAVDHELARGLQGLLDFAGTDADFGDAFDGVFEDEEEVTLATRAGYVQRRVRFELRDGVRDILLAMRAGFESVLDVSHNNAMQLLSPAELEMMVVGVDELDFAHLRDHCRYEGGYDAHTNVVRWFWDVVVDELSAQDQRLLLVFATGSSHAPMGGLRKQDFLIQRAGPDSDQLPTASTCFETLLLPEYASKDKLRSKLTVALRNAQGFGLQ